jgi:hypothetical protein
MGGKERHCMDIGKVPFWVSFGTESGWLQIQRVAQLDPIFRDLLAGCDLVSGLCDRKVLK